MDKTKGQKKKQWSTKYYTETKDPDTRTPLETRVNAVAPERSAIVMLLLLRCHVMS